jgi:prepilin-type N-terminal cleavage/methylation domain-containing protein
MKTKTSRRGGFTLVEIMIVVAIIGLLAAIAIPNFIKARTTSQANACINNLRQMDGAGQEWALEYKQPSGGSVGTTDITPYIKLTSTGALPGCPGGGSYAPSWNLDQHPSCSLSTATPAHALP